MSTQPTPQASTVEEMAKELYRASLGEGAGVEFAMIPFELLPERKREGWRLAARRAISLLTRPSVDEEFVMAAKALRNEASSAWATLLHHTIDGVNDELRHSIVKHLRSTINDVDAALESVEGKPAQPTAVDERRVGELIEERLKASPFYGVTLRYTPDEFSYRTVPSVEVVKKMIADALERAQAKPVAGCCSFCGGIGVVNKVGGGVGPCPRCKPATERDTMDVERPLPGTVYVGDFSTLGSAKPNIVKLEPAPAVKGEAVASWVPSVVDLHGTYFDGAVDLELNIHAIRHWERVRRLISQRVPRVDVRALLVDYHQGAAVTVDPQTFDDAEEAMSAALAKQSIPTKES